jgi:hypothetical protein
VRALTAALLAAVAAAVVAPGAGSASRRVARLPRPAAVAGRRPAAVAGRRRGRPSSVPGPVVLDLVAAVLRAGAPVTTSVRAVGECLGAYGAPDGLDLLILAQRHELALGDPMPGAAPWVVLLDETLLLAREAGLAPGPLLTSAAQDERARVATAQRLAAARLGVRVVLPTGLCLLPAFVLLTVMPLVLALLGAGS